MLAWLCDPDVSTMSSIQNELLTLFMSSSALSDIKSIVLPMISCMGIIHDLRRPMERKNTESTIGDQKSLREYG